MNAPRFSPEVTARRARKLLYGSEQACGLAASWVGLDISRDIEAQYQMARQAVSLLGVDLLLRVVHASFAPLFSGVITSQSMEFIAYRLAANLGWLSTNRPLPSVAALRGGVPAPVQVVHAAYGWSRGQEPEAGSNIKLRVIDGSHCPLVVARWFSRRHLYVLARILGFTHCREPVFSGQASQLYGMRFVVRLEPSRYDRGSLTFERAVVGQFKRHNRQLMRQRAAPCPANYTHPCHQCSLGEDECPAPDARRACRAATLIQTECKRCNTSTLHDHGECVLCRRRPPSAKAAVSA